MDGLKDNVRGPDPLFHLAELLYTLIVRMNLV